jgi:hypothetical protein
MVSRARNGLRRAWRACGAGNSDPNHLGRASRNEDRLYLDRSRLQYLHYSLIRRSGQRTLLVTTQSIVDAVAIHFYLYIIVRSPFYRSIRLGRQKRLDGQSTGLASHTTGTGLTNDVVHSKNHPHDLGSEQQLRSLADERIVYLFISLHTAPPVRKAHMLVLHIWARSAICFIIRKDSSLPLSPFPKQSMPSLELPSVTCRLLTSARVSIGLNPEFSASASGIASSAVANARIAYCSIEGIWLCKLVALLQQLSELTSSAFLATAILAQISAAPPPYTTRLSVTRFRTTQSASCSARLASSII